MSKEYRIKIRDRQGRWRYVIRQTYNSAKFKLGNLEWYYHTKGTIQEREVGEWIDTA